MENINALHLASDFSLPLEAVTETFAILAKRGAGKTYTASVFVEEMLKANQHVVVADPVGVWWGLRASADAERPGLPIVVIGGEHGDLPLNVESGEMIAELIITERISAVLDLSLFRKGEQAQFMTAFAETLYRRNRLPLHLVLDEADAFAPQNPFKGGERLLGAIDDLVRRGRARGIGITLISQRAAVINKNVLTQTEVLIALRTTAPQDRDAIDGWIKANGTPEQRSALLDSLASLPIGTAWFSSPGWLDVFQQVHIRQRETFDSSATPKIGQTAITPRLAEIDLDALRERFAQVAEQGPTDDTALLRAKIRELEQRQPQRIEVPVLTAEQVEQLQTLGDQALQQGQALLDFGNLILVALKRVEGPAAADMLDAPISESDDPAEGEKPGLYSGERRILAVLAQRHPIKLTRQQIATLSGYSAKSSTFKNYFGNIKRRNLIAEIGKEASISPEGFAYLGADVPPQPKTTAELLALWRSSLYAGEAKILDVLVANYPHQISRALLASEAGFSPTSSTFKNYLGTLRRNGLADVQGDHVRASESLFLDGKS